MRYERLGFGGEEEREGVCEYAFVVNETMT